MSENEEPRTPNRNEYLSKREAYFWGKDPVPFGSANITPIMKAMDALVSEMVAIGYGESYPRWEDA